MKPVSVSANIVDNSLFFAMFDAFPVGVFYTDIFGNCIYANAISKDIANICADDAIISGLSQVVSDDNMADVQEAWFSLINEEIPFEIQCKLKCNDDSSSQVLISSTPEYNRGKLKGFVSVLINTKGYRKNESNPNIGGSESQIHELVEQTKKITQAKIVAEEANIAKSDFLSTVSHELRTPMNAILGFSQLLELESEGFSEVQKKSISEILKAGNHLIVLINEILDVAKNSSGMLRVDIVEVSIAAVVTECLSLIQPLADKNHLQILNNTTEQTVLADAGRIKQVLINLLSNAVKYNRESGSILMGDEITIDNHLRISITDTGFGLTEEEIDKLFVPFQRLDTSVSGTGIGLVISKQLIDLMSGKIGIVSKKNVGSTFWIELPLA